jgi:hypothetical protein
MNSDAKKIAKVSLFSLFFLFIIIYAFFTSKDLLFGVKITNVNINDGVKVAENVLEIKGNARNAVNLTLNGREISIDKQGNFNETIILLPGYNIVNIRAKDKFGNIDEKNYKLSY